MERTRPPENLREHIVICNCNSKVPQIVEELFLAAPHAQVLLIIHDPVAWAANPGWHPHPEVPGEYFELVGMPSEQTVLERANVKAARAAIILADPRHGDLADARTTLIALAIEEQNREVQTVVELVRSENREHLALTAVDDVVCVGGTTEKLIAQSCVTPWVKDIFKNLMSPRMGTAHFYLPTIPRALIGATYREIARRVIEAGAPFVVCGFVHQGSETREVIVSPRRGVEPGKDTPLGPEDLLIIVGTEPPEFSGLAL